MSNTPRTDYAKEQYLTGKMGIYGVLNEAHELETELARLRTDLERFTGHGLLDCHAICDQRDAAVAERDRLRAEVERLKGMASWAHTCIHHNDAERAGAACPCCAITRAEKAEDIIRSLCKICGTPIGAMVEDITPAAASQIPARSESKSPCPATD